MRQTSKSDPISDALMSLKHTLGPFGRSCGLRKVGMRWMVLDQSWRLAFSGIHPVRTWWEKLSSVCGPRLFPLSLRSHRLDSVPLSLPVKLYSTKMDAFSYTRDIRGSAVASRCLIWMPWRRAYTRRGAHVHASKGTVGLFFFLPSLLFSFCPKDDARLVFCSCWWWRAVLTVRLSVGLMHYNAPLPCCVNSLSLLIENMEASHLAGYTSAL